MTSTNAKGFSYENDIEPYLACYKHHTKRVKYPNLLFIQFVTLNRLNNDICSQKQNKKKKKVIEI